jgi:hypothetical protein
MSVVTIHPVSQNDIPKATSHKEAEVHAVDAPLKFKSLTAHRIRSVSIEVEDVKTARWLKEQAKE